MLKLQHKNLKVWKKSILLVKEVYRLTNKFPEEEKFGLTNQMRRASVSIPSNISEGSARTHKRDRVRFYEIARSSLVELDTQIEIACELTYLQRTNLDDLSELLNANFALLSSMVKQ
ncbi:MAG: four helix bundle protein [Balneolaceae bacterium]|nr:four helix bundle protein [Balneolaceae bacterium]